MGRNLPPGVSVNDLPGNEPIPEPEGYCPHCQEWYGKHPETYSVIIDQNYGLTFVNHTLCPVCGEVIHASLEDHTEMYLESWRTHPEGMERTIDEYSELREIGEVND